MSDASDIVASAGRDEGESPTVTLSRAQYEALMRAPDLAALLVESPVEPRGILSRIERHITRLIDYHDTALSDITSRLSSVETALSRIETTVHVMRSDRSAQLGTTEARLGHIEQALVAIVAIASFDGKR